jgi:hypothetical protein
MKFFRLQLMKIVILGIIVGKYLHFFGFSRKV